MEHACKMLDEIDHKGDVTIASTVPWEHGNIHITVTAKAQNPLDRILRAVDDEG